MKKSVLIVEDEPSIQRILQYDLTQAGFAVDLASDGETGLNKACKKEYDIILLDVMLPKLDGFQVCEQLRVKRIPTYIVMLSARDDELDRVKGLDVGADDYMTKPFSSREVVSKLKAIIRRKEVLAVETFDATLTYKGLKLDSNKYEVKYQNEVLDFTLKEFELLEFMIKYQGQAVSRDILLDRLWGFEYDGDTRIVDVHIFKIREKFKLLGIPIKTVRGVGYMLESEKK
ncbi:MAG TPA: DNA-binding response regulator [Firmicutes bacterium]|nr:DNA-binding response regulator [Bacillota bacterium]